MAPLQIQGETLFCLIQTGEGFLLEFDIQFRPQPLHADANVEKQDDDDVDRVDDDCDDEVDEVDDDAEDEVYSDGENEARGDDDEGGDWLRAPLSIAQHGLA